MRLSRFLSSFPSTYTSTTPIDLPSSHLTLLPALQPASRLLLLPRELRVEICTLALAPHDYSIIAASTHPQLYTPYPHPWPYVPGNPIPTRLNLPALTRTNRQLRAETLKMFFNNNRFHLVEAVLQGWIFHLPDAAIACIRHLRIAHRWSTLESHVSHCLHFDLSLTPHEPFFKLELDYEPSLAKARIPMQLREELEAFLQRALAESEARVLTLAFFMSLMEKWTLWCSTICHSDDIVAAREKESLVKRLRAEKYKQRQQALK